MGGTSDPAASRGEAAGAAAEEEEKPQEKEESEEIDLGGSLFGYDDEY